MKNIFKMLKQYKKEAILAPLFKLIEAVFELCIPLIVASLIDNGIKVNDSNHILLMSILLVVFPICGLLFSIIAQYFSAVAAVNTATTLRHDLFSKIQSLSYSEYDTIGTSSLITTMSNDVNQVQTGINLFLRLFLRSPIVVFGATIMALIVDIHEGLIFIGITLLLFVVVFLIMKITIPLYVKVQSKIDRVLKTSRENLSGSRVVRAFNKEEKEINDFTDENNTLSDSQINVGKISSLLNPLTFLIINSSVIILIYVGAIKVNAGNLTQGKVLALYNYMSIILVELIKLANLIITINKAIASSKRINEVLNASSSLKFKEDTTKNNDGFIVFDNVSFKYNKAAKESLNNVSFACNKGETIGIIGATGSGKTTLINLIGHFYDVTNGNIYIDGKNVSSYELSELRNKIGMVPQKSVLFKGTIKENIKWGNKDASDEEIIEALKLSDAYEIVMSKENGLDSVVYQEGRNFSGGQRQRLALARALIRKPEILILDDSTSALDYLTESKIKKNIASLSYNPTVFIVSQRSSSIKNANKIIVLDNGNVVGIGTHKELINNCLIYQQIHDSQLKKGEYYEK